MESHGRLLNLGVAGWGETVVFFLGTVSGREGRLEVDNSESRKSSLKLLL